MIEYGYFTFPALLIALTAGLYWWQEPRMKSLEYGRLRKLDALVEELFDGNNTESAKIGVRDFLETAFEDRKDVLMPVKKFTPYKRILQWLTGAFLIAAICALFQDNMQALTIGTKPDVSALTALNTALVFLCALPAKWLWEEFRYMQRVIKKLEQ